jgi:hypothetical protein
MAFTDFKSADEVQKAYQVRYVEKDFITFTPKSLPEYFVREFEFDRENFDVFGSEASRCETEVDQSAKPIPITEILSFLSSESICKHHQNSPDRNHDRQTASNSIEHFFVRHKTLPIVRDLKIIRYFAKITDHQNSHW